ncbi:Uncharacterised protein [Serratia liquefaciens]|nr:Uncharacterised protein [Serratia liquefaciens]
MVPVFYYANYNPYHPPTKLSYLNGNNDPIQPINYRECFRKKFSHITSLIQMFWL